MEVDIVAYAVVLKNVHCLMINYFHTSVVFICNIIMSESNIQRLHFLLKNTLDTSFAFFFYFFIMPAKIQNLLSPEKNYHSYFWPILRSITRP